MWNPFGVYKNACYSSVLHNFHIDNNNTRFSLCSTNSYLVKIWWDGSVEVLLFLPVFNAFSSCFFPCLVLILNKGSFHWVTAHCRHLEDTYCVSICNVMHDPHLCSLPCLVWSSIYILYFLVSYLSWRRESSILFVLFMLFTVYAPLIWYAALKNWSEDDLHVTSILAHEHSWTQ